MDPTSNMSGGFSNLPYNQAPQTYVPDSPSDTSYSNNNNLTGQVSPPKNNKKLIFTIITLVVLTIIIMILAVVFNVKKAPPKSNLSNTQISRTYDSPVGLLSQMQSSDIKSGRFKLRSTYIGNKNFEIEGSFSVEDGKIYFGAISDVDRVNEFMKQVYDKQPSQKKPFNLTEHGVSNFFSYDFASIMGYYYLYDQQGGALSGFIPEIENAKASNSNDKRFTLNTACDAALSEVKKQTNMSTTSLLFDVKNTSLTRQEVTVSFATRQSIDTSVRAFFDKCYELSNKDNADLANFVNKLKENTTKSPDFVLGQENGVDFIEVNLDNANSPFGGNLRFELTKLSKTLIKRTGSVGSYLERRNQFGLAYSICRVDPVVTKSTKEGYRYFSEDQDYTFPSKVDTGYYCRTLDVPPQYLPASSVTLKSSTSAAVRVPVELLDSLRGTHDLIYEIERFNRDNKRYPSSSEFNDMVSSTMGSLTAVTHARFEDKSLSYTALPTGCAGTCNDYALGYTVVPNVQIRRSTYLPHSVIQ